MGALRKGWLIGLAAILAAQTAHANSPAPAEPPQPAREPFASVRAGASPWVLAVITRLQTFWNQGDYPGALHYLEALTSSPGFARRSRAEQQTIRVLLSLTQAMPARLDATGPAQP